MQVLKARKKPIIVEVFQWDGTNDFSKIDWPDECINCLEYNENYNVLNVKTKEGYVLNIQFGDYICRGIEDEIWPIRQSIFEKTYEICQNFR